MKLVGVIVPNELVAALTIAAAGLILLIGASSSLSRARKLKSSLFNSGAYSRSQLQEVELAVLTEDDLPSDPGLRAITLKWAREEALLGPRALRWQPFQYLGAAMALTLLYLVPVLGMILGVAIQAIVLLLGAITFAVGVRGVGRARKLLQRFDE
jgi:Flp pilus assembly protein TadB